MMTTQDFKENAAIGKKAYVTGAAMLVAQVGSGLIAYCFFGPKPLAISTTGLLCLLPTTFVVLNRLDKLSKLSMEKTGSPGTTYIDRKFGNGMFHAGLIGMAILAAVNFAVHNGLASPHKPDQIISSSHTPSRQMPIVR